MGGRPVHIVRGGLRRVRPRAADDQRVRGAGAGRLRGGLRGRVRGRPPPRDPAPPPPAREFFRPVPVGGPPAARPAARKTLSYTFDDPGKLSAAVDKLTRSGRTVAWAQVADALGGSGLRPPGPGP